MTQRIPRRRFLQHSTVAGVSAGLALSGRSYLSASPADRVVVGVMGLGRGRALAVDFAQRRGCEVKYLCDVDSTRAEKAVQAVETAGGKRPEAITDFRTILDDKSVDALVCAAPNHWHAPATILGCAAGKHVYVEKPCSHTAQEGEWMIAAARKHKRAVQMGAQRRTLSTVIEAIERLHAGAIGRVYMARGNLSSKRGPTGTEDASLPPPHIDYDLWQGPAPRRPFKTNVVHYTWHWNWHWGNGELGNNGVHSLDLCRWGMGVDYPTRVSSAGGRYRFEDDQETPDTHTVCFEFEGRRMISWEGLSCNKHRSTFVVFYGEDGTLELDSDGTYRIYDADDKVTGETKGPGITNGPHQDDFLAAIRNDTPLSLALEIQEGHKSTLLCHLGNIAHRTGRALRCSPRDGHIQGDPTAMQLWGRAYEPGWQPEV